MVGKFLDGKKKYSAFIITILATLIPLFIQDPEGQKTFMDLVPSLATLLAGVFYIVTEAALTRRGRKLRLPSLPTALPTALPALPPPASRTEHKLSQHRHRHKSSL